LECASRLVVLLVRGPFFGLVGGDGEEGVGEHGEGDVSVPGVPGADLVVVEANLVLADPKHSSMGQRAPATWTSSTTLAWFGL